MRRIAIAIAAVGILFGGADGAYAKKARCELVKSTGTGVGEAMAKELAMQSLVEAVRDSRMKGQGKISYKCRTQGLMTCTAQQRACRAR